MKHGLAAAVFLLSLASYAAETELVPLNIGGQPVIAEVAHTPEAREQGLKYRKHLRGNHGMLFIYPQPDRYEMWMKDTSVPLSVAFLDEQGVIINVADMAPFSEEHHQAAAPAKYALEMPIGWFDKRGIKPGAKVEGLSQTPRAE